MKSVSFLTIPAILTFFLLSGWQNAQSGSSNTSTTVSDMVVETLVNTEEAIALLRINPESAKVKIEHALSLIKDIGAHFDHHTVASLETTGSTVTASDYRHYYPKVDLSLLSGQQKLPTLAYKLNSDILYQGNDVGKNAQNDLYFDYTFAKASLRTARDATASGHALEAMANLRRVFEAVYVSPDFNVSANN